MRRQVFFLILILNFIPLAFANKDEGMTPAGGFFLPDGNVEAGQKAFARLKCNSCHWVQNEIRLSEPVAEKTGPMIGWKQASYSPGWIANSIVSPSHTIALDSDGEAEGSQLSRMGDFKDIMTVRELMDIVSYIKSLNGQQDSGGDL